MTYCDDIDLLSWEPNLFKDAAWASQTLLSAGGDVSGTTVTLVTGTLLNSRVRPRNVCVLTGTGVNGSFPIVSVVDNTHLTISTLYDDLYPPDGSAAQPGNVGAGTGLSVVVRTFSAQAAVVSGLLSQACGIVPGTHDEQDMTITNTAALRRPCALGVLQMVYGALAAAASSPGPLEVRADFYGRAYRRALRHVRAELDTNGDGIADVVRPLNVMELVRS